MGLLANSGPAAVTPYPGTYAKPNVIVANPNPKTVHIQPQTQPTQMGYGRCRNNKSL